MIYVLLLFYTLTCRMSTLISNNIFNQYVFWLIDQFVRPADRFFSAFLLNLQG